MVKSVIIDGVEYYPADMKVQYKVNMDFEINVACENEALKIINDKFKSVCEQMVKEGLVSKNKNGDYFEFRVR